MRSTLQILAALAISAISVHGGVPDTTVIATVNGVPVVGREVEFALDSYRLSPGAVGVRHGTDERDSARILLTRALNAAVRTKVELIAEAKEHCIPDPSYSSLKEEWKRENERRKQTAASGGIVYGPISFSEPGFYGYYLSTMSLCLREKLFKSDTTGLRARVRQMHDSLKDNVYQKRDTEYGLFIDGEVRRAVVNINQTGFDAIVEEIVKQSEEQRR